MPENTKCDSAAAPVPFATERDEFDYDAADLARSRRRVERAISEDLALSCTVRQQMASAWLRICELRHPGQAVPGQVKEEMERLDAYWSKFATRGGIANAAQALNDDALQTERARLHWMLRALRAAEKTAEQRAATADHDA